MNILRILREQAKEYDCSVCGENHSRSDIRVLGRLDSAWVVKVTCSKCQTTFKLLVMLDRATAIAAGDEDAATRSDTPKKRDHPSAARRRRPVSADEVLDAHELLRVYEGPVDGLFGTPVEKEKATGRSARRT